MEKMHWTCNVCSVFSTTFAETVFIFDEYLVRNKHKQAYYLSWLFNDSVSIETISW